MTLLTLAARAHAADPPRRANPLKTSLVWLFGDDDVTHAPAEVSPPSPGSGIGDRPGYDSLLDGFASRYTGRENRSELRLDGDAPGLFPRLTTRAGLALGVNLVALGSGRRRCSSKISGALPSSSGRSALAVPGVQRSSVCACCR